MSEIYHVYNRSISQGEIFKGREEYLRFINAVRFYQVEEPKIKFSDFLDQSSHRRGGINWQEYLAGKEYLVEIIAYCIMPTHFHLLLGQLKERGLSIFSNNVLNSYTRYINTKCGRKGTLWEGRTKRVLVQSNEQLLHLTRYIHLNPVTACLVEKPEKWMFSSYREYISEPFASETICKHSSFIDMSGPAYKKFVEDGIAYQRDMARAKKNNPADNPTASVGGT